MISQSIQASAYRRFSYPLRRCRPPAAYTLLELLLVLAILALLVGSTWSGLQAIQGDRRLREVADQIRHQLASCRLRAIDAGVVYQFRYQPGGTSFQVMPLEPLMEGTAPAVTVTGELPAGLSFAIPPDESATASFQARSALASAVQGARSDVAASGGIPILFAPDGTASDGVLEIADQRNRFVRISVRGLTAAIAVGSPQSRSGP